MVVTQSNAGYRNNPYGITIFQSSSASQLVPQQLINDCLDLGFTWIRYNCNWSNFEQSQGVFTFTVGDDLVSKCNTAGINLLWTIDCNAPPSFRQNTQCSLGGTLPSPSDVNAYATAVSARYNGGSHGLIQAIEVGNEGYDLVKTNPVNPTDGSVYVYYPCRDVIWYYNVLKTASQTIRANIPGVIVGSAAMLYQSITHTQQWVQAFVDYGLLNYCDYLHYHYYKSGGKPPTYVNTSDNISFDNMRAVIQQVLISNGTGNFPLWVTETGYPTNTLYTRSQSEVVDFSTQQAYETIEYEASRKSKVVKKHFRYTLNYNTTAGSSNSDGDSLVQGSLDMRTTVPWYSGLKTYIATYPSW